MKRFKILLLTFALSAVGMVAFAQDFSDDAKFGKYGQTVEERTRNIQTLSFFNEACKMKDYQTASSYLPELLRSCPKASENMYVYGATIFKGKIAKSKTLDEKNVYIDSLMMLYDLRLANFGSHPKRGAAYILGTKAREYLTYKPNDRAGVRDIFKKAIAATDSPEPELVAIYYKNLCDDFKNGEVTSEEVISEYDRLSFVYDNIADTEYQFRDQFDTAFGTSGAADCGNLEKLFSNKFASEGYTETNLAQAVKLMSRAKCEGKFFLSVAEKYYTTSPTSENALFLAQIFQNEGNYDKATVYLRKALEKEKNNTERAKLLSRIAIIDLAARSYGNAASAARQALEINPDDGTAYFVLGQCYAASASSCGGFDGQSVYWAAYDAMAKAQALSDTADIKDAATKFMASYRRAFPSSEDCFFQELSAGSSFTVRCGAASGVRTTVRYR